jgi:transposase
MIEKLEVTDTEKIFYIDEAGLEQYIFREYAKSARGQKVYSKISGKRYVRTSVIAARNYNHKFVAPFIFEGMTDKVVTIFWAREILLPELPPNSILVWDNASFHKSNELRKLVEEAGHTMIFLPPYSPDLNPIEHKWHELKHNLKSNYNDSIDFIENLMLQINLMSI